ncbi:PLSCR1 [Branchiostoma lanceolatum]|uniref:Phospholipid scramblase n=1 Tax=Branchiostoma lanceolatum TaxID=7740 RepID=A0A8J9Z0P5_BRALA|nr:PLSCR1 [Branchiostoma lanceolatum]
MSGRVVDRQPKRGGKGEESLELVTWMGRPPDKPTNCPAGLEYLTSLDKLRVSQTFGAEGPVCNFENNNYVIKNGRGQQVYFASEETNCFCRQCCGPARAFHMSLYDKLSREVLHLVRPARCDACCFPCCLMTLTVKTGDEETLGYVKQKWNIFHGILEVQDAEKKPWYHIRGPACPCRCFSNMEFKILSLEEDKKAVGSIAKRWGGPQDKYNMDHENFEIEFPYEVDVRMKAVLLGACFLVNYMYFEMS